MRTSKIADLLFGKVKKRLDSLNMNIYVYNNQDTDNNEIYSIKIVGINKNVIKIKNSKEEDLSFAMQDIYLDNFTIIGKNNKKYRIIEHIDSVDDMMESYDTLILDSVEGLSIGDILTTEIKDSIFLSIEKVNVPRTSYGNRRFCRTEIIILKFLIKIKDNKNLLIEDITDIIKEIYDNKNIEIEENIFLWQIEPMRINDLEKSGVELRTREIKSMLGYNLIETRKI